MISIKTSVLIACDTPDCDTKLSVETDNAQQVLVELMAGGWGFDQFYHLIDAPIYCPFCMKKNKSLTFKHMGSTYGRTN